MLGVNDVVQKLYKSAEEFEKQMQEKKYFKAKNTFYTAMLTAKFIELDKDALRKLFGENGAFKPEQVRKAFEETRRKRHADR